jgi:hypothetical protein
MVVPPSPRKPLSSLDNNASTRKVQLSLDNFFHRPSAKVKRDEPFSAPDVVSYEETTATTSPAPESSSSDLEDFCLETVRPTKKRKQVIVVPDAKTKARRPQVQRKLTSTTGNGARPSRQAADQSDLPPLFSIPKMFDDLVSRAGKLDRVVDKLNGRKLRVATMCSGTESPLLALRMITRSLFQETGKKLEVEHIFSCEIEPFKQAYIERNFSPPILFRDVLELADDYAYSPSLRDSDF